MQPHRGPVRLDRGHMGQEMQASYPVGIVAA